MVDWFPPSKKLHANSDPQITTMSYTDKESLLALGQMDPELKAVRITQHSIDHII